jgi:ferredoxin
MGRPESESESESESVATVRFFPSGRSIQVDPETSLFDAVRRAGLPLGSSCRGEGACGWCRVTVLEGREHLAEIGLVEANLLARIGGDRVERIACLARVEGGRVMISTTYW